LLSHAPETSDSEFTWDGFQQNVNKDLADVLGNFVSRITKFCRSKFGTNVPDGGAFGDHETAILADLSARIQAYQSHMDAIEIRKAAAELRAIWVIGNEYLQLAAPWTVFKTDPAHAAAITRFALNLIPLYAGLSAPFIPNAAADMAAAMRVDLAWPKDINTMPDTMAAGHAFEVPDVLFAKITDEDREIWQARFAGQRS
jgi:methionyl-tRNA synthetase